MNPVGLLVCLSVAILSSQACLPPNTSYALCSPTDGEPTIQSEAFSKDRWLKACLESFIEKIFNQSCSTTVTPKTPTAFEKYVYGFAAVFIVSALSLAGLLAFPFIYQVSFQYVLSLFTALAVGTLFGDTMFHLIPFALGLHGDHDHESPTPDYLWKLLLSVLILYSFYLLEVLLHSFAHYKHESSSSVHFHAHGHSHSVAHHKHSHSDGEPCEQTPIDIDADLEHGHRLHNHRHHNLHQHVTHELNVSPTPNTDDQCQKDNACVPCAYANEVRPMIIDGSATPPVSLNESQTKKPVKSTGWMVLIGDGIHNFADGLAIGAAFSQDLTLGLTTTLAVAFHELPHELGDYAVLIQSGFTHYQALFWNFLSATTALIGFFLGVALSTDFGVRQWIFAVTVGMFLYIALVDLLPTLLADGQVTWKRFLVVNLGFLLGIGIMFLIALFEDRLIHSSH